ncbi:MAG: hypothetical protein JSR54_19110, partial [Proteobacteria bacterium]|nr:hypothetical protein [Pseudomonadota bacterium]
MTIDEELLMRYADGELGPVESAAVADAAAADPALASRLAALQAQRARLRAAYAPQLAEPVPDRLHALLAGGGGAEVVDLAGRRRSRATVPTRRWSWREWSAMAASVAVGMLVVQLWSGGRGGASLGVGGAGLASGSALAQALSTQLAANQPADAPVRVGVSFRSRGELCRTFVERAVQPVSGLACFANGRWRVDVAATGESGVGGAPGALRPAASEVAPAVLDAVTARIEGEPLDAAAERAARARGWVEAPRP